MTEDLAAPPSTAPDASVEPSRIAFERLRERTDELEIILSGLLAFALLALPTWLFDGWSDASTHAEGVWDMALLLGYMLGSGLSYTLAAAFLMHLAVRGYWVGLIGLKASFSRGIRWDSIATMGPVARAYYQKRLPDLMTAIDRADRAGSILFAITILIALTLSWIGIVLMIVLLLGSLVGAAIDNPERGIVLALGLFYLLVVGGALLLVLLDAVLIKRRPELQNSPKLRRLLHLLIGAFGLVLPQRLILPVQLTLQSNLSSKVFVSGIAIVSLLAPIIGMTHLVASQEFAVTGSYRLIDDQVVDHGIISAHYESARGDRDRLLRYPTIPSDLIADSHLRVFIPHLPSRDNAALKDTCPITATAKTEDQARARAIRQTACIGGIWNVSLNGEAVDLGGFLASERRDLGMRGIQGYLPLENLQPGRQDLLLVWNPDGPETGRLRRRSYHVPFWFAPAYEMGLEAAPASTSEGVTDHARRATAETPEQDP